ncbi:MAG: hypothetical protein RQ806_04340, partial [Erythrobacter sp.]|nr:hypothetical protein [Erythrobacter sp.]
MMRIAIVPGLAALLAGCGTPAPLTPPQGATLPVAPYGALTNPTAEELLRRDAASKLQRDHVRPPAQAAFVPVCVTAEAVE